MDTSFINKKKNKMKTRLGQMLTMQKLLNGQDDYGSCSARSALRHPGAGAGPAGRTLPFTSLGQDEPRKWAMLTCLHFGVVHPVRHLFLTDEVVYNLHSNRRF